MTTESTKAPDPDFVAAVERFEKAALHRYDGALNATGYSCCERPEYAAARAALLAMGARPRHEWRPIDTLTVGSERRYIEACNAKLGLRSIITYSETPRSRNVMRSMWTHWREVDPLPKASTALNQAESSP